MTTTVRSRRDRGDSREANQIPARPILTRNPVVTNPPGNALLDFRAIGFTPMHQPTPLGAVLGDRIAVHAATPGAPFGIARPAEYVGLGLQLCSQGGRLTPMPDLQLSNASDVVLGDR